jgi:uncharacterized protein (DUF1800 family)
MYIFRTHYEYCLMRKVTQHTGSKLETDRDSESGAAKTDADSLSSTSSANFLQPAALSLLSAALLAACGGGGADSATNPSPLKDPSAGTTPATPAPSPPIAAAPPPAPLPAPAPPTMAAPGFNNFAQAQSNEDAARFLLQSQFSASDAEISAVRSVPFATYLQQQFAKRSEQTGWDWLNAKGYTVSDKYGYYNYTYVTDFMLWNQLITAPDAMRKRIALALSEFFVVSMQNVQFTWVGHAYAHYWDQLVSGAFGNFRNLLQDVTLSPVMGNYLNTKGNQKEDSATGRVPDENYAREVMQLFSIGLTQLNPDGTEKTDANRKKLDTYAQSDVTNLARVFTGYDFDTSDGGRLPVYSFNGLEGYDIPSTAFARKPMSLDPAKHSDLAATFLGTTIPAGTSGAAALQTALDVLFNHPNVGPFFGKQMIQRLVTSNPSPAYVGRVAAAFNNNGQGIRGDLKAVWMAILLDDEARDPQNTSNPRYGKVREPMLRFVQWARTFGLTSKENTWKLFETTDAANSLGQSPMRPPSVFNFFRPGFVPPNTVLAGAKAPAPEFQIVNETSVGGYLNFMQDKIYNGFSVPEPDKPYQLYVNYANDIKAQYGAELAIATDAAALVARLNVLMCAGQLSAANVTLMVNALNATPINVSSSAESKLKRVCAAVFMVMASAQYIVQK